MCYLRLVEAHECILQDPVCKRGAAAMQTLPRCYAESIRKAESRRCALGLNHRNPISLSLHEWMTMRAITGEGVSYALEFTVYSL